MSQGEPGGDRGITPLFNLDKNKAAADLPRVFDEPIDVEDFKAFSPAVNRWKEIMVELYQIRNEYEFCKFDEASELRARWRKLVYEGDAILDQLLPLVLEEFRSPQTPDLPELGLVLGETREGAPSVMILGITAESTARSTSLRVKDVITAINGKPFHSVRGLADELGKFKPGEEVAINYLRVGEAGTATITLGSQLGDFVGVLARKMGDKGHFEVATEAFTLLRESKLGLSPVWLVPAAVSAYATAQFDDATQYFALAKKHKQFLKQTKEEAENSKHLFNLLSGLSDGKQQWDQDQFLVQLEKDKDDLPQARIVTTRGSILIELYENDAPNAVAHFISLAEKKFFDDKLVNLSNNSWLLLGAPNPDGTGLPGYTIYSEATPVECRPVFRGSLFLPRESVDQDTFGSKFAIAKLPMVGLKGRVTCFGRIVSGYEILEGIRGFIRPKPVAEEFFPEPDKIVKIEIIRKRDHDYIPVKVGDEPAPADK